MKLAFIVTTYTKKCGDYVSLNSSQLLWGYRLCNHDYVFTLLLNLFVVDENVFKYLNVKVQSAQSFYSVPISVVESKEDSSENEDLGYLECN